MSIEENNICPICDEGKLHQETYSMNLEFKGTEYLVEGFLYSICESCDSEVTNPTQSLHNKRIALEARKKYEKLLSGDEIKAIRHHHDLTQQQAAAFFGGGTVAFSKYEKGDVAQSTPMDRLLRVADAVPEAYQWLVHYVRSTSNELDQSLDEKLWEFSTEKVLEVTKSQKTKKGRALHTQYEEMPFFYDNTLAANGNDEHYETEPEPLSA